MLHLYDLCSGVLKKDMMITRVVGGFEYLAVKNYETFDERSPLCETALLSLSPLFLKQILHFPSLSVSVFSC